MEEEKKIIRYKCKKCDCLMRYLVCEEKQVNSFFIDNISSTLDTATFEYSCENEQRTEYICPNCKKVLAIDENDARKYLKDNIYLSEIH